jgi:peptidoglycan/xylan/chitin deacetylase (PgdA/CDA1 family)
MTTRAPGMDHELYPFSALPSRPVLRWPGGARLAVSVVLYLEHWEMTPPGSSLRDPRFKDPFGDFAPDYRTYSMREYGNRVGIFRIFEALDRIGWPVTVATNAAACARYPNLIEACAERGWEFAAHGLHATRMISARLEASEERRVIAEASTTLEQATGVAPLGWIAQDFGESARTPRLLAEAGFEYVAHWPNDDQPYWMTTSPPLLSIPCQAEWDDVNLQWHRRIPAYRVPGLIDEAMAVLHQEGAISGRTLSLGIHPWLWGMPHRIRYLNETLDRLAAYQGIWPTRLGEVSDFLVKNPEMIP